MVGTLFKKKRFFRNFITAFFRMYKMSRVNYYWNREQIKAQGGLKFKYPDICSIYILSCILGMYYIFGTSAGDKSKSDRLSPIYFAITAIFHFYSDTESSIKLKIVLLHSPSSDILIVGQCILEILIIFITAVISKIQDF